MYEFVRGPLLWVAFIVFLGGLIYRVAALVSLSLKKDKVVTLAGVVWLDPSAPRSDLEPLVGRYEKFFEKMATGALPEDKINWDQPVKLESSPLKTDKNSTDENSGPPVKPAVFDILYASSFFRAGVLVALLIAGFLLYRIVKRQFAGSSAEN
jgi:hypothetical protein